MEPPSKCSEEKENILNFMFSSKKLIAAPMVMGSELPFRMMCRTFGADVCYSPMLVAEELSAASEAGTLSQLLVSCSTDRPLVVQICGNDPDMCLKAGKAVENYCDALDINLGCPQRCAERGHYGAYLMDSPEVVEKLVAHCAQNLKIPVFCKMRVFPEFSDTLRFAKMLQLAGCQLLTVHARRRELRHHQGPADWQCLADLKAELSIPVVANGNVQSYHEALDCLRETQCDGVMSATGLLRNPALFSRFVRANCFKMPVFPPFRQKLPGERCEWSEQDGRAGVESKRICNRSYRLCGFFGNLFSVRDRSNAGTQSSCAQEEKDEQKTPWDMQQPLTPILVLDSFDVIVLYLLFCKRYGLPGKKSDEIVRRHLQYWLRNVEHQVDLYALLNNPKLKTVDQFCSLMCVWCARSKKNIVCSLDSFFSQVEQLSNSDHWQHTQDPQVIALLGGCRALQDIWQNTRTDLSQSGLKPLKEIRDGYTRAQEDFDGDSAPTFAFEWDWGEEPRGTTD
mmetsp:Transcript_18304/g.35854  ORF Transcript_18304/g.35854 Transcript_18304/m.35854 type:complete len:510 (-) Transcript_18304:25-1554(-)